LKISSYHKSRGDTVSFKSGTWRYEELEDFASPLFGDPTPDVVYITSLFTFYYKAVHDTIDAALRFFPNTPVKVGGIYASLCPENIAGVFGSKVKIHVGIWDEVERYMPDYSLVPNWDGDILFASRGCINKCKFCAVPKLEPVFISRHSIKSLVSNQHSNIVFWDNNILASPFYRNIFRELIEIRKPVDFNQGIEAKLLDEEVAWYISHMNMPVVRLAYDRTAQGKYVKRAVELLHGIGVRPRDTLVYCLYNFTDTPDDFFHRCRDLAQWGATTFPMRYEPLIPSKRYDYISPSWTPEELKMVDNAKHFLGVGGAFPPKFDIVEKFSKSKDFAEAFTFSETEQKEIHGRRQFSFKGGA
jgi:hypothetical protein